MIFAYLWFVYHIRHEHEIRITNTGLIKRSGNEAENCFDNNIGFGINFPQG